MKANKQDVFMGVLLTLVALAIGAVCAMLNLTPRVLILAGVSSGFVMSLVTFILDYKSGRRAAPYQGAIWLIPVLLLMCGSWIWWILRMPQPRSFFDRDYIFFQSYLAVFFFLLPITGVLLQYTGRVSAPPRPFPRNLIPVFACLLLLSILSIVLVFTR